MARNSTKSTARASVEEVASLRADSSAKASALNRAVQQIERQFGKGSVMKLDGDPTPIDGVPTGALSLDIALGNDVRHIRLRTVGDAEGGCVLTFDDATRIVTAQRHMAWRDVARRIAHEIRNPLTPIQLATERLRRRYGKTISETDDVFERSLETITRQVEDIGRMVEEFSSFARM
ncbi:MAG: histidine kinase dimerization/phospho-acceptor domain-containing protein, partial [Planctomycetota bacterium]